MKEAAERGKSRGIELDAADVSRSLQRSARVESAAASVYTVLARIGGSTEKGLKRHITTSKRPHIRDALHHLEDQGRAHYDGATWRAMLDGRVLD